MQSLQLTRSTDFKLPTSILGADLAEDGQTMVAGCLDGVYLIDLISKKWESLGDHDSYVSSTCFLRDATKIISAGYDGKIQWFSGENFKSRHQLQVHQFWSWDMAVSPDATLIASVTGQYIAGGYKYEPQAESEPSVRILTAETGEVLHSLSHVPSVQCVAFSHDGQFVAAGNLMGEVRIWNCQSGELVNSFTTPDFTSWGIIKSHCYLGGIFCLHFTPDDQQLLLCGMGPMGDPMAGNGRQLWQKWSWRETPPQRIDQTHEGESGEGLMETLAIHPSGEYFAMGGRLRGGDWNLALFDLTNGNRIATIKSGYRITQALFTADGNQLVLVGTQGQPSQLKEGKFPDFGRVEIYDITTA